MEFKLPKSMSSRNCPRLENRPPQNALSYNELKFGECANQNTVRTKRNGAKSRPSQVNANEHAFFGWILVERSRNLTTLHLNHLNHQALSLDPRGGRTSAL